MEISKKKKKKAKIRQSEKSFLAIASFLQEVKAGLDLEIGMYHCLVATEEERLGLQPGDGGTDDGDDGGGNDDDGGVSSPLKKKKVNFRIGRIGDLYLEKTMRMTEDFFALTVLFQGPRKKSR